MLKCGLVRQGSTEKRSLNLCRLGLEQRREQLMLHRTVELIERGGGDSERFGDVFACVLPRGLEETAVKRRSSYL